MNNRKDEHLKYALEQDFNSNLFSDMRLIHNSISDVNFNEVDLKTKIFNKEFEFPIYINAITGGTEEAFHINKKLAKISNDAKILFCFGSISPLIKDRELISEYKEIIKENKNLIFSLNVGADKNLDMIYDILIELKPSFLQVHLNTLQELIMPEGDRDFTNVRKNLKEFILKSPVPVIVKEVGFGMSSETINDLSNLGAKIIDISGKGGTNFALIENNRRSKKIDYLNNWGLSTFESMLESKKYQDKVDILASGGIATALDIIKCLILGAKSVGLAGSVLKKLSEDGFDNCFEYIEDLKYELKLIMTLLNAKNLEELKKIDYVIVGGSYYYCKQRELV